ncbi:MAG: acyl-CoA dehydrogenase family protein [Thermoplasmata archaeon]
MEFQLSEEQKLIRETARAFVDKEVIPHVKGWEEKGEIPRTVTRKMADLGFFGIPVPKAYGGSGLDYVSFALVVEEIARGCNSLRTTLSVQTSLAGTTLLASGSEEQKKTVLAPLMRGEFLGAWALTEPDAGSDAANLRTTATREGDEWVLNGAKRFISNGNVAEFVVVFARKPGSTRQDGISAFLVRQGTPGFQITNVETNTKLGLRASPTADLAFDDCRIPGDHLIGTEGTGWETAMYVLNHGRLGVAAGAVGIGQACLELSIDHAKERRAFDRPIGAFQLVREMIAEMAVEVEAARLLYLKAAWLRDQEEDNRLAVSLAKLFGAQMAVRCADRAVQIYGGYGFSGEYPVERHFRDAKILGIYEGTNEIQKMVIAHELLGELRKAEA